MKDIEEIFRPALGKACRVLSLMEVSDADACARLHGDVIALLSRSWTRPIDDILVLANVLADVMARFDVATQDMLAEDVPVLIGLARERIEDAGLAAG